MRNHERVGSITRIPEIDGSGKERKHHIIGEMPDHEIRSSGMPLFDGTSHGRRQAERVARRMSEQEPGRWQVFHLEEGERYLKRTVVSDRREIYTPAYHGVDDGYHGSKETKVKITA